MTTTEERLKILKMIQEGTITAEEGAKLLTIGEKEGIGSLLRVRRETLKGQKI